MGQPQEAPRLSCSPTMAPVSAGRCTAMLIICPPLYCDSRCHADQCPPFILHPLHSDLIIVDTSGRHKQEDALFEEMRQVAAGGRNCWHFAAAEGRHQMLAV